MANFSALKTAIQNAIKQNGNEEITGDVLQQILLSIVSTMGDGSINTIEQNLSQETLARQNADTQLQSNINAEALARGNADTQLQNAINAIKANIDNGHVYAGIATPSSTPVSGKVFYIATSAGTYTNFGGQVLTQGINILRYNGSAWSSQQLIGIDDAPTAGSNSLVKSGGVQNELALGAVYDVSAKNPTGGHNSDGKWESLSALLSDANLNTLIPTAYRKGGMSIKFVQSSDNNYVQYRFLLSTFTAAQFTNTQNWENISALTRELQSNFDYYTIPNGGIKKADGEVQYAQTVSMTPFISIVPNHNIIMNGALDVYVYTCCAFYNESKEFISCYEPAEGGNSIYVNIPYSSVPQNAKYFRSCALTATENKYIMHDGIVNCNVRLNDVEKINHEQQTYIDELKTDVYGIKVQELVQVPLNAFVDKSYSWNGTFLIKLIRKDISEQTGWAIVYSSNDGTTLGNIICKITVGKDFQLTTTSPYVIFRFGKFTDSARQFELQIKYKDNISNEIDNLNTESEVENITDNLYYVNSGRLDAYISCSGVIRVKLEPVTGSPVSSFKLYFSKNGARSKMAYPIVRIGNYVDIMVPDSYDGIYVWAISAQSADATYRIVVDRLDTEFIKTKHKEKILIFGDSITEFDGQSYGTNLLYPALRYSDWMQVYRPGIEVVNVGIGGTRLSQRTSQSNPVTNNLQAFANLDMVNMVSALCDNDFSYQDATITYFNSQSTPDHSADIPVATLKTVDLSKIDIVIIAGGTNDYNGGSIVGESGSSDKGTIIGAINTIVSKLLTTNPNLKIFFVTPPVGFTSGTHTDEYWKDNVQNSQGKTLADVCHIIEDNVGKLYLPVFDMHFTFGWNQLNFEHYFPIDSTHPYNGFDYIGKKLIKYLFGLD